MMTLALVSILSFTQSLTNIPKAKKTKAQEEMNMLRPWMLLMERCMAASKEFKRRTPPGSHMPFF